MKIVACGDIAICRNVESMILNGQSNELAKEFRNKFNNADLFIANIECPLTDHYKPEWDYFPTLKGSIKAGEFLGELGIDVASLANNHIADSGKKGMQDTIALLEKFHIPWTGAGWSPEEARRPLIVNKNNLKIGILALAQQEHSSAINGKWGAGLLESGIAINTVKALKQKVNFVIVYLHFGVEFFTYPTIQQVQLSRSLIDAGANMVIGHHPHVPQGYEYYNNGFIAYSLGNFIFDMQPTSHQFSRMGLLIEADVDATGIKEVNVIPVDTNDGTPVMYKGIQKQKALNYLEMLSSTIKNEPELLREYYFTCRGNLEIHCMALTNFCFIKRNLRRIRDIFLMQFWPQLKKLRIDLIRFLFSGDALMFEKKGGVPSKGIMPIVYRCVCIFGYCLGLGWGHLIKVRYYDIKG